MLTADHWLVPAPIRRAGVAWVMLVVPVITWLARSADTRSEYIFVFVVPVCATLTTPALFAGWYAVRHAPPCDEIGYRGLYAGLVGVFLISLALILGIVTGWHWGNGLALPTVLVNGTAYCIGLTSLARQRSGRRALSVDMIEAVAALVAVTAPMAVLWGPTVLHAPERWWTLSAALAFLFTIWATYWGTLLLVRLGPGRDAFDVCALGLWSLGACSAALQTAQGVSGFTLPAPPLIAVHAACYGTLLLIPLHVPKEMRPGMRMLPPQAQVRGARMALVVGFVGLAALLVATLAVVDERPGSVPFSLAVISVLFVLAALRQILAAEETKRLYSQVALASEERRLLLARLLQRATDDRRSFAGHLYAQAMAAYASFNVLVGSDRSPGGPPPWLAEASARVGGDLARNAESVRELVLAIRPLEDERDGLHRLATPITAYLAALYGDRPMPRLTVTIPDHLRLDWISETVLLQIVQDALHNVWQHGDAESVSVTLTTDWHAVTLRVADDGAGFDLVGVPERTGLATMRAAVAVVGGSLLVDSAPGGGTTITARLAPDAPAETDASPEPASPHPTTPPPPQAETPPSSPSPLRLVRCREDP